MSRLRAAAVQAVINGAGVLATLILSAFIAAADFAAVGVLCTAARGSHASAVVFALALLAVGLAVAQTAGVLHALPFGVVAVEAYDWFFLPPLHHLNAAAFSVLGLLIAVAVIVGSVTTTVARHAVESAHARGDLADEQAALRRVATLVGGGANPSTVFAAISDELGRLLGAEASFVAKLNDAAPHQPDADPTVTIAGSYGRTALTAPVGLVVDLQPGRLLHSALTAGGPVRADIRQLTIGPLGTLVVKLGVRVAIAAPIMVGSRAWGVTVAGSSGNFSPDAEARLANFVELAAMAIQNTETREDVNRLVKVQQSLQRLSLLVAQGQPPEEVFAAVTNEVHHHLSGGTARLLRYELDGTISLLAEQQSSTPGVAEPQRSGHPTALEIPIHVNGRLWGLFHVDGRRGRLAPGVEAHLTEFTELVAASVANAQSRTELTSSRARIIAAGDETRRRIERDLHDGIQQSLVALALRLRTAAAEAADRGAPHHEIADTAANLTTVIDQLRELSRGVHPVVLSHSGLHAALVALSRRAPLTVHVDAQIDGRLPTPVEIGAYYTVSEALTNAVKHAGAANLDVHATTTNHTLTLRIRDDGIGGADPARGTGLLGLRDRIQALGGTFDLHSPPRQGTTITCHIPIPR